MEQLHSGDPQSVGPYRVISRLGSGAMGRVFLAESAGQWVALKVIQPGLAEDRQFRARFRQEVRAAQRVSGPFTASVLAADPDGEPAWMATEYVPGPTLQELIENQGPGSLRQVAQLATDIATALSAIHAAGVVHRDLKPTNVVVPPEGPARVIDFGIARAADATVMTATGLSVGSVGYMSPEQAEGTKIGPPADVFALGALLYFSATGGSVFGTGSAPGVMYRVVHVQPDLSAVADPGLRALIGACLAKAPEERPSAEAIRAACASDVVVWAQRREDPHRALTEFRPVPHPTRPGVSELKTEPRVRRTMLPLLLAALLGALAVVGAVWLVQGRSAAPATGGSPRGAAEVTSAATTSPEPPPSQSSLPSSPPMSSAPGGTTAPTPSPTRQAIEAAPAKNGRNAEIMRNAPPGTYGGCIETDKPSAYGGYPEARCNVWTGGAHGFLRGDSLRRGPQRVACQRDLGIQNRNPVFSKNSRETNTWWVWTRSDKRRWDWFPATAIKEGASDEPINGIALCNRGR